MRVELDSKYVTENSSRNGFGLTFSDMKYFIETVPKRELYSSANSEGSFQLTGFVMVP